MSTLGVFSTSGDTMTHVGDLMSTSRDIGDIMMHVASEFEKVFQFLLKTPMY